MLAHPRSLGYSAIFGLAAIVGACASIPGESAVPYSIQRAVRDRVLAAAKGAAPQCRQPTVTHTELLEVHADGRPAQELWVVDACGRRLNHIVTFPPKRATGTSLGFSVRPEY